MSTVICDDTTVLLIGAELSDLEAWAACLDQEGYSVQAMNTAGAVWRRLFEAPPTAILVNLSDRSAGLHPWELCQELATAYDVQLIGLLRNPTHSLRLRAYALGVQLVARLTGGEDEVLGYLRGQSERLRPRKPVRSAPENGLAAALILDRENRGVRRGNQLILLSRLEFALLEYMALQKGRTIPQSEILKAVWKTRRRVSPDLVKIYFGRLRQKIEPNPQRPVYFQNIRGVGYCYNPEPAQKPVLTVSP